LQRSSRADHRISVPWFRQKLRRLPSAAANLDRRDAAWEVGYEERTGVRLDRDECCVDFGEYLDILDIVRIDPDIDDPTDQDSVIFDIGSLLSPVTGDL
jgi:hypothetical protein